MGALAFARSRLDAFIEQVSKLDESEFPYQDSQRALWRIKGRLDFLRERLDGFSENDSLETIKDHANRALDKCVRYLPVLGFILRSTNVRNGFELVGPLRRVADNLLRPAREPKEAAIQLLLSSEWDYMPRFRREANLPGYVMIGLPAHESSNPLLFPLCGHELGHALWAEGDREGKYSTLLGEQFDASIVAKDKWSEFRGAFPQFAGLKEPPDQTGGGQDSLLGELDRASFLEIRNLAVQWATMQAEEIFCDFVGLRLFGRAYSLAFSYLMFPGNIGKRLPGYPNVDVRVGYILQAASKYSLSDPGIKEDLFDSRPDWELPSHKVLMNFADKAVKSIVDKLIDDVKETAGRAKLPSTDDEKVGDILAKFHWAVPASGCRSLADILDAGWRVFEKEDFWKHLPNIQANKDSVLKELLLKNIELFEVEQIHKDAEARRKKEAEARRKKEAEARRKKEAEARHAASYGNNC